MILKDFPPGSEFREYVKCYRIVHFRFDNQDIIPTKFYPPKPEQVLHFWSVKGFAIRRADDIVKTQEEIFFSGQQTYVNEQITRVREYVNFQIVFQPSAFYRITGIPPMEFNNKSVDASYLFPKNIRDTREQLQNARNYPEMLCIGEAFVKSLVLQSKKDFNLIDSVANSLIQTREAVSMDRLASESCLSTKQFYRKFTERTGMNPKDYLQIVRFNKAYNLKNKYPHMDWLRIAIECDYYDYQHLVKAYKHFTGLTPTRFNQVESKGPDRLLGLAEGVYRTRI